MEEHLPSGDDDGIPTESKRTSSYRRNTIIQFDAEAMYDATAADGIDLGDEMAGSRRSGSGGSHRSWGGSRHSHSHGGGVGMGGSSRHSRSGGRMAMGGSSHHSGGSTSGRKSSILMRTGTSESINKMVDVFFEDGESDDENDINKKMAARGNDLTLDEFHPGGSYPQKISPRRSSKQGGGRKIKKGAVFACLAILIVVILVGGFFFLREGDNNNNNKEKANISSAAEESSDKKEETPAPTPSPTNKPTAPPEEENNNEEEKEEEESPAEEVVPEQAEEESPAEEELTPEQQDEEEAPPPLPPQVDISSMDRPDAIRAFLMQKNITLAENLNAVSTPAALAMKWMIDVDSAKLTVPGVDNTTNLEEEEIRFLQRYSLAVFYFSMEDTFSNEEENAERRRRNNLRRERNLQEEEGNQQTAPPAAADEAANRLQFDEHWTVKDDVCDWFGVECNQDNFVTALDLKHTKLSGPLVPEIFQEAAFPHLTSLDLSNNNIKGDIPCSSNNQLEVLLLKQNRISGSTAESLDRITNHLAGLVQLDLQSNEISGTLPENWSLLSNLEILKLGNNKLTGSMPTGLGSLSKLHLLQLDSNQLTGTIPSEYSAFENSLHTLKIADNKIEGTLPEFLSDLRLIHASLQGNEFSGTVPSSLGQMTTLVDLHLHMNHFKGTVPGEICALMMSNDEGGALQGLTVDCKEPKIECSCCSKCY